MKITLFGFEFSIICADLPTNIPVRPQMDWDVLPIQHIDRCVLPGERSAIVGARDQQIRQQLEREKAHQWEAWIRKHKNAATN